MKTNLIEFHRLLQRDILEGHELPYFDEQGNRVGKIISVTLKDSYIEITVKKDSDGTHITCSIH